MQGRKISTYDKKGIPDPTPPYNNGGQSDSLSTKGMFNGDITWCLDWVSFVGHEGCLVQLREVMAKYFKYSESDYVEASKVGGRFGYLEGVKLAGCMLLEGHSSEKSYWNLQVQGKGCQRLGNDLISFIREVLSLLGVRITRVDVAIDNRSTGAGRFLDSVQLSCERDFLCFMKSWSFVCGSSGGKTVYLGSRKSPKFIRVYDKGTETGTLPPGRWVRFEAVFRADIANKMICENLSSGLDIDHVMKICRDSAVSLVDFREKGDSYGHLERGKRVPFWSAFISRLNSSFIRYSVDREPASFSSFKEWLKTSVAGPLEAAIRKAGVTDWTAGQVLDFLTGDVSPSMAFYQDNLSPSLSYVAKVLREHSEGLESPF